ncbi:hypothetical protein [Aliarcobacter butzleri]|uniref:hypothetical protein n=1 Tax=Aliarcobacter butzleri TaxID=28197 RepID=UPI0021B1E802|nr:hypothetical protein [Aliarcobacter butzleri]MCT7596711.1 hypothetical protein [Aliarcobacter butzleri]
MLLFYKVVNMLANIGIMLLLDKKLTKEEIEKKAKKKLKLIEERRERIQKEIDELARVKELFFGQDVEVEDLK